MRYELSHDIGETIIGACLVAGITAAALFAGIVFGPWYSLGPIAVGSVGFMWCMCAASGRGDKRAAEMTDEEFARRYPLEGTQVDIGEMERMYKVVAQ